MTTAEVLESLGPTPEEDARLFVAAYGPRREDCIDLAAICEELATASGHLCQATERRRRVWEWSGGGPSWVQARECERRAEKRFAKAQEVWCLARRLQAAMQTAAA